MKWYSRVKDIRGNEHDMEIPDYHTAMSESCEVFGACAIADAKETLQMALELVLEGRTTAKVSSRYYNGHFYEFNDGHAYCGWWGT